MSDIRTFWDIDLQQGDYRVVNGSLNSGHDIETAVLISLLTDKLALLDDNIPDAPQIGMTDRRGWWADDPAHRIGSKLWLLDRAKGPRDLVGRAEGYAREALQWMLTDGAVARFEIKATWIPISQLALSVIAYRKDGGVIANTSISIW